MKLAIDVMGFENSCNEAIVACRHFAKRHKDVTFVLVGKKNEIMHFVRARDRFEIIDAQDVIQMTDQPLTAMRRYETSMYKAVRLVADDQADGVLSAGSTAVYVPMVYYWLKLLPGINKPAFMPLLPTNVKGKMMSILDVGANKECTGQDLYNFALMAKAYFQLIKHYQQPRVGVINIGTEATKGFKYQQDANELLLADKSFNYIGFIEPRSLLNDTVDIAICDGYSGNLTLKAIEGGLKTITGVLKQSYKKI
jgi:glycerol-3-phosphate acyltransferase PlsX